MSIFLCINLSKDKKQAAVDEIVRQGYFYEYGVLDEEERLILYRIHSIERRGPVMVI